MQPNLFPMPEPDYGHELTDDELTELLQDAMRTSGALTARADFSLAAIGADHLVNRLRYAGVRVFAGPNDGHRPAVML